MSRLQRSFLPLNQQIDAILRDQIANGSLRVGDRLPTEDALRRAFSVSRATVRQALGRLERAGIIERLPGRGTFLRLAEPQRVDEGRAPPMAGSVALSAGQRDGRVIRQGEAPAPAIVAELLELPPAENVAFVIKVLTDDQGPRSAVKRYLPLHVRGLLHDTDLEIADFRAALGGRLQAHVAPAAGFVEAILAEPRFAMMLKVPVGSPLLSIWTVESTSLGPVACAQTLLPAGSVRIGLLGGSDEHG